MKTIRALRGTTVALLVVAGALPAVQAQGIPSVEACIRYAEADAAFDAAMQPADAAYEAAVQQAQAAFDAAFEAAKQPADAALEAAQQQMDAALEAARQQDVAWGDYEAAYKAAQQRADAAYKAAVQQADVAEQQKEQARVALEAVMHPAEQALVAAYSAIYDLDGGPRSDVPDVMSKLIEHHRQRCRELHGL